MRFPWEAAAPVPPVPRLPPRSSGSFSTAGPLPAGRTLLPVERSGHDSADPGRQGDARGDQGRAQGPDRGARRTRHRARPRDGAGWRGPGHRWYVNAKHKDCAEVGIASIRHDLPAGATQSEVEAIVDQLNADPACTGYLVQQPTGLDEFALLSRVDPGKDVDGLHPTTSGASSSGTPRPCRAPPWASSSCCAVMTSRSPAPTSSSSGVDSRSGRPLGLLLTRRSENATVTLCHTGTRDLARHVAEADIVVAAAGVAGIIRPTWSSRARSRRRGRQQGRGRLTAWSGWSATSTRRGRGRRLAHPNPGGVRADDPRHLAQERCRGCRACSGMHRS
jgi:hypothetical protein